MKMIKDHLTIVIPSKNESKVIDKTLTYLNKQHNIKGTRVIVADCSNDDTRKIISSGKYKNLNIEIIDGGLPSVGRNKGAKLSNTEYVLFMDADIFLTDSHTVYDTLKLLRINRLHLVTTKFRVKGFYSFVFPIFEFVRDLGIKKSPCAIGGYMLFDLEKFNKLGGFNDEDKFAEDFHLSMKVDPLRFFVSPHKIYTTDRRFKKKGLWYMLKLSFLSYVNKNNPDFFKNDHNYWV
jgi:glycosyltransferase involved in cell wall biosynthesis